MSKANATEYVGMMRENFNNVTQAADIIAETAKSFDGKAFTNEFLCEVNNLCCKTQRGNGVTINKAGDVLKFSLQNDPYDMENTFCLQIEGSANMFSYSDNKIQAYKIEALVITLKNDLQNTLGLYEDAIKKWDEYKNKLDLIQIYLKTNILGLNSLFLTPNLQRVYVDALAHTI